MGSRAVGLYKEGPGGFPGPSRSQATAGRQRFGDSAGGRSMAGVFCLAREIELGLAGLQRSRQNTSKAPLRYQIISNASGRPRRPSKGNRPTLQKATKKKENGQDLQNSGTCGNLGPSKTLPPEQIGLLPNCRTQPYCHSCKYSATDGITSARSALPTTLLASLAHPTPRELG